MLVLMFDGSTMKTSSSFVCFDFMWELIVVFVQELYLGLLCMSSRFDETELTSTYKKLTSEGCIIYMSSSCCVDVDICSTSYGSMVYLSSSLCGW
jgi:hypothetical protein